MALPVGLLQGAAHSKEGSQQEQQLSLGLEQPMRDDRAVVACCHVPQPCSLNALQAASPRGGPAAGRAHRAGEGQGAGRCVHMHLHTSMPRRGTHAAVARATDLMML